MQHQLEEDEDLIAYKDKKNSALYPAFLPNGRSEYTQATLLTAELLLSRAATLGPDFDATRYTAFLAAFVAARSGTGAGDEQSARARAEAAHRQRLADAVPLVPAQHLRLARRLLPPRTTASPPASPPVPAAA